MAVDVWYRYCTPHAAHGHRETVAVVAHGRGDAKSQRGPCLVMQCVPLNVSQLKRAQPRGRLPWRPIMFMGLQVCIRAFTVPRGVACVVLVGVACCDTMSTRLVRSVGNMSWVSCTPCTQMLSCLEAMHCVGVVHRDVKPSNFLVDVQELCVPHPPPLPLVPPLPYHPPTHLCSPLALRHSPCQCQQSVSVRL